MKNIAIIGGGSVGLLFASYLTENFNVTLYTKTTAQADVIAGDGIVRTAGEAIQTTAVEARSFSEGMRNEDFVIVAVKQYHLDDVLSSLQAGINHNVPVLFVQNGMGHIHKLKQSVHQHIFLGVVEHGALKIGPNKIHHTGMGVTNISCYRGEASFIDGLIEQVGEGFPFRGVHDWREMLIGKLIINACINPLTALYREKNGRLIEEPFYYQNLQIVFNEVISALHIADTAAYWEKVTDICRRTASNRSSMLRDIEAGRETEVEAILGYILREAAENETPVPVLTFLYNAIKGLEMRKEVFDG
jgi:2-dehydropantoate 2-reductase